MLAQPLARLCCAVAVGVTSEAALGINRDWVNALGGSFQTAGNWSPAGVPTSADVARFALDSTFTTTFAAHATTSGMMLLDGHITFDLNGFTYNAGGFASLESGFDNISLTVRDGTLAANASDLDGGDFTITTVGRWTHVQDVRMSRASLSLVNGGDLTARDAVVGYGDFATATVTGNGATVTLSRNLIVGAFEPGVMVVETGGDVVAAGSVVIGDEDNPAASRSSLTVRNTGSTLSSNSMWVGQQHPGRLLVETGADVTTAGNADIGDFGAALAPSEAVFDGTGTTWDIGNGLNVGGVTGGSLIIRNGAAVTTGYADITFVGTPTNGSLLVTGAGSTFSVLANALRMGGNGAFTVGSGATADLASGGLGSGVEGISLLLENDSVATLDGGTLNLDGRIDFSGGAFQFIGGKLHFNNDLAADSAFLNGVFGTSRRLTSPQHLSVAGAATLTAPLVLDGGTLSVGSLSGADLLSFDRGTLNLTQGDLTIGFGGLFGAELRLLSGHTLNVANNATVSASFGSLLMIDGGTFSVGNTLTNQNEILLEGGAGSRVLGSTLLNAGRISGDGFLNISLINQAAGVIQVSSGDRMIFTGGGHSNEGRINLLGGIAEFGGQLVQNHTGGEILGHGTLRTNLLFNDGTLHFSGVADLLGPVTNNPSGLIHVTGVGPSTFFDDLNNGGEVRVSEGATAVFFGHVTNTGTFSGPGTKLFEGGSSGTLGALASDGSTIVEAGAAVTARHIREAALTVRGQAQVLPGGTGANRFEALNVSGQLDLSDNDLIVDYAGTDPSPEFELRDLVLSARDGGATGIFFTRTPADDTILAFGEASELGITDFSGFAVDATTVVGKYTYYGDANLDGQVTTDDYVAVDLGLGTGDSWVQGDLDLNGAVTTDDYVVVDLNLGKGTSNPLAYAEEQAAMIALHTEMFGRSYVEKLAYAREHGWVAASVPEPGGLGGVMFAAAWLGRSRRRGRCGNLSRP